ncbi:hypothetical protein Dolphis_47 [Pseudomonas phage Dolphis]|nr:hypothetical protein Dolphis_47 [Pseudomonas phage Dolphis]
MSQELIHQEQQQSPFNRGVQLGAGTNVGAVAIEQERAIAEAQGQLVLAKKFPRNEEKAYAELMKACKLPAFASVAFYNVPRAGGSVSGPSIRLAEEVARVYGNFQYGHRELSRDANKSEVEVFAWDMEKNNRSIRQITVFHVRDTQGGAKPLRDQKDVDDKIANVASKQVRGRILALMPKWLVESAIEECRKTIAGNNDEPIEARVRRMTQAFAKFGVTVTHLERYLGHALAETTTDEIADLQGIHNAIKEGTAPSEFFAAELEADKNEQAAASIADTAKSGAAAASAAPAAARQQRQTRKPAEKPSQQQAQVEEKVETKAQAAEQTQAQQEPESKDPENNSNAVEEPTPEVTENTSQDDGAQPANDEAASDENDVF